jgi:hypothetical protein
MLAWIKKTVVFRQPVWIANLLLCGLYLAFIVRRIIFWFPLDAFGGRLNMWAFTDWMIDYSSGFTRRGLSGELLKIVLPVASPEMAVSVFSWLLFLIVVLGYLRMLLPSLKSIHPLMLIGMLFLPSLLLFYVYEHEAFARKELLAYAVLLWHLFVVERSFPISAPALSPAQGIKRYIRGILPIAVIGLPVLLLIHEGIFILFVPVHAAITYWILRSERPAEPKRAFFRTVLLYLPATLTMAVIVIFGRPTIEVAQALCQKWELAHVLEAGSCLISNSGPLNSLTGAFSSLAWTIPVVATFTLGLPVEKMLEWVLLMGWLSFCLWFAGRETVGAIIRSRFPDGETAHARARYAGAFFARYFLFPMIVILPLFIPGYDFGRWFAALCVNFSFVTVSVPLHVLEWTAFTRDIPGSGRAYPGGKITNNPLVFYLGSIAIGLTVLFLRFPHCCLASNNLFSNTFQSFLQLFFH